MDAIEPNLVKTRSVQEARDSLSRERQELLLRQHIVTQRIIKGADGLRGVYEEVSSRLRAIEDELMSLDDNRGVDYIVSGEVAANREREADRKIKEKKSPIVAMKSIAKAKIAELMKFRNLEECKSSKRSAPFYMSKEAIVKAIDSDKELKNAMPKGYKAKKKEEICDALFV